MELEKYSKKELIQIIDQIKISNEKEIYNFVANGMPLGDMGNIYLRRLSERYTARKFLSKIPIFEKAYELLTERKNFSRRKAFGVMHGDRYIWIEKCKHSQVIVEEGQSYKFIFIFNYDYFHIRQVYYKYAMLEDKRKCLPTLKKFRETDFKLDSKNKGLYYGDNRDEGYLGSLKHSLRGFESVESGNQECLYAIKTLDYWEIYLDNPDNLE